jgi:hypothetical protein
LERRKDEIAERVVADATAKTGRNFKFRKVKGDVRRAPAERQLDAIRLDEFPRNRAVRNRRAPDVGEENPGGQTARFDFHINVP